MVNTAKQVEQFIAQHPQVKNVEFMEWAFENCYICDKYFKQFSGSTDENYYEFSEMLVNTVNN